MTDMDFSEWVRYGVVRGWAGVPVCATHDGVPETEAEWDSEACVSVIRLYSSDSDRVAVESEHPPSKWRKSSSL